MARSLERALSYSVAGVERTVMQGPGSLERAWDLNRGPLPVRTRGLVRAALRVRLLLSRDLVYADAASVGGLVGLVASRRMRRAAAAAVEALGVRPNRLAAWRFASAWWYQRVADGVLAFQADQLTAAWADAHVTAPDPLPGNGCILLSVHQFNQRLAFARLSTTVEELGAVSMFETVLPADPDVPSAGHVVSLEGRHTARSLFAERVFGDRMYLPPFGASGPRPAPARRLADRVVGFPRPRPRVCSDGRSPSPAERSGLLSSLDDQSCPSFSRRHVGSPPLAPLVRRADPTHPTRPGRGTRGLHPPLTDRLGRLAQLA